jgi:hypothetical protein
VKIGKLKWNLWNVRMKNGIMELNNGDKEIKKEVI